MPKQSPELDEIVNERGKFYGDPLISHKAIGHAFRAVLQNAWHDLQVPEIGPELTALLLATFKVTRAARPEFKKDSYDDAHVYLNFSEEFRDTKKVTIYECFRCGHDKSLHNVDNFNCTICICPSFINTNK